MTYTVKTLAEHPDFRKLYDSWHPGLAADLAKAMTEFASRSGLGQI